MKRSRALFALLGTGLVLPSLLAPAQAEAEATPEALTAPMTYRSISNWEVVLPAERWTPVSDEISLEHAGGSGFAAERTGELSLDIDANGDGRFDTEVKGTDGFVKLRARDENGERFQYAVRIVFSGGQYRWASSGVMAGKLNGVTVRLIDQNSNGIWNEVGTDAMTIGGSKGASLLSSVVSLDGELFDIDVAEDGSSITATPYRGETATIDAQSKYKCSGKLVSAVFSDAENDVHFNLARSRKPLLVPAGTYELAFGYAERGTESVQMRGGHMRPITVDAREERVLEWGGKVVAEFDYEVIGEQISVGKDVRYYGQLGEEYHTFQPNAKSPKIIVTDSATRKEVASGRFGGC